LPLKDENMDNILVFQLCAIPIISAVTGYVTNYIAVRMLFRPRHERRVLGISFHGLIPHRRAQIAESIGQTVEQHLISHEDIRNALQSPDVSHGIETLVDQRVTRLLKEKLATVHPMVGFLLNEQMIEKLKGVLMGEIMSAIPEITDELLNKLEKIWIFASWLSKRSKTSIWKCSNKSSCASPRASYAPLKCSADSWDSASDF
jgi:uncharacterized membrane protein YheB (UPF0754 family)